MKKIFCDICKQETKDNYKYILPYWNTHEVRGGKGQVVLTKCDIIDDIELDICKACRPKLATVIKILEVENK